MTLTRYILSTLAVALLFPSCKTVHPVVTDVCIYARQICRYATTLCDIHQSSLPPTAKLNHTSALLDSIITETKRLQHKLNRE